MRTRTIFRQAFFVLLTSSALVRAGSPPSAPDITLARRGGPAFPLSSLRGKVVLLDFWASWCVPCRTSFPFFDGLQKRYGARGLEVVGLTLEQNQQAVDAFLEAVPVRFSIALDPSGRAGEAFSVVAMPTTFLLDRDGRIVARFEGGDRSVHTKIEAAVEILLRGGTLPSGIDVRVASGLGATGTLKAWDRTYLADPIMSLDGDRLTGVLREHVHASKEGAAGSGGAAGGGCGCN